jgi:hypothetical protein
MLELNEYSIPNQVTFAEALELTKVAITEYGGMMSNKDVAEKLGYKVKSPTAISGYIYRKFDDVCSYGLMTRERGGLRATDTANKALDPYDSRKASEGKAEAIKQMPLVNKAFNAWKGEIPIETAFPAKLSELITLSWQDAQKYSPLVRKLFIEVFPYIEAVKTNEQLNNNSGSEGKGDTIQRVVGTGSTELKATTTVVPVIGELRTEDYGILKLKDVISLKMGITTLQSLLEKMEKKLQESEKET